MWHRNQGTNHSTANSTIFYAFQFMVVIPIAPILDLFMSVMFILETCSFHVPFLLRLMILLFMQRYKHLTLFIPFLPAAKIISLFTALVITSCNSVSRNMFWITRQLKFNWVFANGRNLIRAAIQLFNLNWLTRTVNHKIFFPYSKRVRQPPID